jgi:hypothetical protein
VSNAIAVGFGLRQGRTIDHEEVVHPPEDAHGWLRGHGGVETSSLMVYRIRLDATEEAHRRCAPCERTGYPADRRRLERSFPLSGHAARSFSVGPLSY